MIRNALFWIAHFVWVVAVGLIGLPARLGSRHLMRRVLVLWARGELLLARVLTGVRYRVIGAEHIPPGPSLIVAKHQSSFESIALPMLIPDLAVVLRYQLLRLPLWGPMVKRLEMIAIDREGGAASLRALLRAAREVLAAGRSVLIFPEARRVPIGERAPYQRGVISLYERSQVPVVPVAHDAGRYWPPDLGLKRPGCITLRFLPPLPPGLARDEFFTRLVRELDGATDEILRSPPLLES
ncbi:MAG: lysophospholipid acyltransferase family protein [Polyangia bacterium]